MYCYAGNNPVRYTDPDGRSETKSEIFIEEYKPKEPAQTIDTFYKSPITADPIKTKTYNQNKSEKYIYSEALFVDKKGEASCQMGAGLVQLSSEMNDKSWIYASGQIDIANADFNCSFTEGGAGLGFAVNGIAASGNVGAQWKTAKRNWLITVGGSVGANIGGEVKIDIDEGFILDVSAILGIRFEIQWGKIK